LPLEELEVAGGALECGEPARTSAATLRAAAAVERRDGGGRADETSQEERSRPAASLAVHARILRSRSRCSYARSEISRSTSSSGSPRPWRRAGTRKPRSTWGRVD